MVTFMSALRKLSSTAGRKLLAPLRQQARADDATQRRDGLDEEHQAGEERNRAVVHHCTPAAVGVRGQQAVGQRAGQRSQGQIDVRQSAAEAKCRCWDTRLPSNSRAFDAMPRQAQGWARALLKSSGAQVLLAVSASAIAPSIIPCRSSPHTREPAERSTGLER